MTEIVRRLSRLPRRAVALPQPPPPQCAYPFFHRSPAPNIDCYVGDADASPFPVLIDTQHARHSSVSSLSSHRIPGFPLPAAPSREHTNHTAPSRSPSTLSVRCRTGQQRQQLQSPSPPQWRQSAGDRTICLAQTSSELKSSSSAQPSPTTTPNKNSRTSKR